MHAFKDNNDRTWSVEINVATLRRVRGMIGVDLCRLVDDGFQPLADLIGDPVQLCDVLFCLCKDETDRQEISDEDFGRALGGDAITNAVDAFVEELIDFFPDPKLREQIRRVVKAAHQVRTKVLAHAEKLVDSIDVDQEADSLISSLTSSPGSSESTPDRSHSESS